MFRILELAIAWYDGHITDGELLDELRKAMSVAELSGLLATTFARFRA